MSTQEMSTQEMSSILQEKFRHFSFYRTTLEGKEWIGFLFRVDEESRVAYEGLYDPGPDPEAVERSIVQSIYDRFVLGKTSEGYEHH